MSMWLFLAVVVAAAYYADIQGKKSRAELVRLAMEKGQSLDPALIERLFPLEDNAGIPTNPRNVRIAAVITFSAGIGFVLVALAVREFSDRGFWIWLGIAGVAVTMACGLYFVSLMLAHRDLPSPNGDPRL